MGTVTLSVASGPISHSGAEARPQANGTHVRGGGGGPGPRCPSVACVFSCSRDLSGVSDL